MPEKITIVKESGGNLNSNIVSIFTIPETQKKYIITTENAVDPHGLTVLHVSEYRDGNLIKIETDEEWASIKTIMRAIISGNVGSYQYLPLINQANAASIYSRDISVSASAEKTMVDNYNLGRASLTPETPQIQETLTQTEVPVPIQVEPENLNTNANYTSPVQEQAPLPANAPSIFPQNTVVPTEEDEVSPGIAEVEEQTVPSVPVLGNIAPSIVATPTIETPVAPVVPTIVEPQEALETISIVPANEDVINNTATEPAIETIGAVVPNQLNASIQQIAVPAVNSDEESPVITDSVNEPTNVLQDNDITKNIINSDFENTIKTMIDQLYNQLMEKEKELKEKEIILNERERMLNEQMKIIMGNTK